jgi:UDP-N-acetylmuramoyl-L-alanyl-D-glutamate--2,6-diaminopimelate ligase
MAMDYSVQALLRDVEVLARVGQMPESVSGVVFDSRRVGHGMLFVAVKGVSVDGHDFIANAVDAGATLIVGDRLMPEARCKGACYLQVSDSAAALGVLASNLYGRPSELLKLVGVTGTNGKTTVATLLYRLCMGLGHKAGLLSTVENRVGEEVLPATHTTPDPLEINELLARMVAAGCQYAFMEVSSHALAQKRTAGLKFAGGVFTNLTRDHIDYHKTFAAYRDAKKLFFDALPREAFAITNIDDGNGEVMLQNCRASTFTYSLRRLSDFHLEVMSQELGGMMLRFEPMGEEVWVQLLGEFNAYNILAVYAVARRLGFETEPVLRVLSMLRPVNGRFDFQIGQERVVIVDYAHTPDALKNVLQTIAGILPSKASVITVVGAGGDRDKGKRPQMAEVAAKMSRWVILTSDNPRGEDPSAIIEDMYGGIPPILRARVLKIVDRREAIRAGVLLSAPGDYVLVAGKGHETYQEVKGERTHFDDREEVAKALELLAEE